MCFINEYKNIGNSYNNSNNINNNNNNNNNKMEEEEEGRPECYFPVFVSVPASHNSPRTQITATTHIL